MCKERAGYDIRMLMTTCIQNATTAPPSWFSYSRTTFLSAEATSGKLVFHSVREDYVLPRIMIDDLASIFYDGLPLQSPLTYVGYVVVNCVNERQAHHKNRC